MPRHSCFPAGALDGCTATVADDPVLDLLRQWPAAGISYCTLRYQPHQTGDVDLLIAESSVDRCREWLEQHGFVAGPGRNPFKMTMLRYRGGEVLCLDIHWKAVQYGIVYMDERRMLERRIESDGLFRLSVEDELLHLVLHNFMRKGALRASALERIRNLLTVPIDRRYLDDHLESFGLRSAFEAAVACVQRHDASARDIAGVRKRVLWAALRARPGNLPRHLLMRARLHGSAKRRGGFVALVGPDGSGKSTVVKALTERARAIPSLRIDTCYLGPWGQMQLPLVRWLRRAGITPTVQSPGQGRSRSMLAWLGSAAKGHVFYAALFIELIYRYVTSVFFRVRRGRWVVADRYITDLRYLYKERPIENYATIRRLLCMLFPKPDLLILLDNRSDVIVSRKGGLAAGQIEVLRHFCLQAARAYKYEVITTDRTPNEIADHMLNRMLALRALK